MNEFRESGNIYVSKSGSDSNAGNTPDFPKLTIRGGLAVLGAGQTLVIGTGIYSEENLNLGSRNIKGDGIVIISALNQNQSVCFSGLPSNQGGAVENIIFTGFLLNVIANNSFNQRGNFTDCTFIGGENRQLISRGQMRSSYNKCKFLNCNLNITSLLGDPAPLFLNNTSFISNSILINTGVNITSLPNSRMESNQLTRTICSGVEFNINNSIRESTLVGSIENISTIESDPLWLGDIEKLEFLVREDSPLIGSGFQGVNIGSVKTGNLQNRSSQEWGLDPESESNTIFNVNSAINLVNTSSSGFRESKEIDLRQIRINVIIRFNGVSDFLNNVIDSNNLLANPNRLTFEAQTAGADRIFDGVWKKFTFNYPMRIDGSGKYTGESGYDVSNENDLSFQFIKLRINIIPNYNQS